MALLELDNKKIYCKEYGKGIPLVLIAGLGSDSTSWLPVIINLSKHFRVIAFDNCGVGQSTLNNSNITIEDMAIDAAELIKGLALEKVNILGHSMGGMIAMKLAVDFPDLVDNIVLAATTPYVNERNISLLNDMVSFLDSGMNKKLWFKNLFYWIFSPKFFDDKAYVEMAITMAINYRYSQSNESFKNQVDALTKFNFISEVHKIEHRTLVMCGKYDLLFPIEETEPLFDPIANKEKITISNAAHSVYMDNPMEFVNEVVTFLT